MHSLKTWSGAVKRHLRKLARRRPAAGRIPRADGFTLVEVLLVVAILGILAGVVVISVRNRVPATQIAACRMSIKSLGTAIDTYEVDNGVLPGSLDALITRGSEMNWNGPYIQGGVPKDPWGNTFQYNREANGFKIMSGGPDGQIGTGDDISN